MSEGGTFTVDAVPPKTAYGLCPHNAHAISTPSSSRTRAPNDTSAGSATQSNAELADDCHWSRGTPDGSGPTAQCWPSGDSETSASECRSSQSSETVSHTSRYTVVGQPVTSTSYIHCSGAYPTHPARPKVTVT